MENNINQLKKKSSIKTSNSAKRYYIKSLIAVALFLLVITLELVNNGGYFDEIIGVLSAIYLIFFRTRIERRDMYTLIIMGIVVAIGVISNLVSGVSHNYFSIVIDIVAETKLLFAYFAMKYFLNDEEKKATINMLVSLAKLFTIGAFVCSIISLFTDIGMTGEERYGIGSFKFIFSFNFQYIAVYMLFFGILVCNTKMRNKEKIYYYAMAIISLVLATKAPPIMFSIIFIGLAFYFKKHERLSPIVIITGVIILIVAGWFQIETYILNENAPRRLFFEYAFKTANNYFPLGSGFGTFGSDQAARNYSQLYYQYGFNKLFGMTPEDGSFLSDTFWPMAIGQFGWVGGILYISAYIMIFLSFKNNKYNSQTKAFLYAAFLQYMIHAVGSAILSSSAGLIGFMALAIFTVSYDDNQKNKSRLKIHL